MLRQLCCPVPCLAVSSAGECTIVAVWQLRTSRIYGLRGSSGGEKVGCAAMVLSGVVEGTRSNLEFAEQHQKSAPNVGSRVRYGAEGVYICTETFNLTESTMLVCWTLSSWPAAQVACWSSRVNVDTSHVHVIDTAWSSAPQPTSKLLLPHSPTSLHHLASRSARLQVITRQVSRAIGYS